MTRKRPKQAKKEQKVKSLEFFKPTLATTLAIVLAWLVSARPAQAGYEWTWGNGANQNFTLHIPPITTSGTWTPTGSLNTARADFTATLLPNGKVLVAGGFDITFTASASAELYDPA